MKQLKLRTGNNNSDIKMRDWISLSKRNVISKLSSRID